MLNYLFELFWTRHLLPCLEIQWCLKGLQSRLFVLSEGQKHAKVCDSDYLRSPVPDSPFQFIAVG